MNKEFFLVIERKEKKNELEDGGGKTWRKHTTTYCKIYQVQLQRLFRIAQ